MVLISYHPRFEDSYEYGDGRDAAGDLILLCDYLNTDEEIINRISKLQLEYPDNRLWSFFIFNEIEDFKEFEFIDSMGIHFVNPFWGEIELNEELQYRAAHIRNEAGRIVYEGKIKLQEQKLETERILKDIKNKESLEYRRKQYESLKKEFENK